MGSDGLRLRTTAMRSGVHLVSATGEVDSTTAAALERELEQVPHAVDVIVDVDGARLRDAAALGVLRRAAERLRRRGNELTVVCEREPGTRTLLRRNGVNVSDAHEGALRYLLGRRLLRRLSEA